MKRNDKLQYTSTDAKQYYYVYESPITKYCDDQYIDISSYWGDLNLKRYSTYIAKIIGRDESRKEIREYIKETRDGIYVNEWKVGDIIKLNKWDNRGYNHSSEYFLVIEKTDDIIRYALESTYIKAKHLFTLGYSIVAAEEYKDE